MKVAVIKQLLELVQLIGNQIACSSKLIHLFIPFLSSSFSQVYDVFFVLIVNRFEKKHLRCFI